MDERNQRDAGRASGERYREAFSLLEALAGEGDAGAQSAIGDCLFFGVGTAQDLAGAAEWYGKAAGQGHARAQNSLGGCFYHGRGVARDFAKAAEWYRKAAGQEDTEIRQVAEMYLNKLRADGKIF